MKYRKIIYSGFVFAIVSALICLAILFYISHSSLTKITFLDVGQGDAILISQGNNQILIDGGPDGTILLEKLGKEIPFWDRQIELIIATHPDKDHIDGLVDVLKTYQVSHFWQGKNIRDTDVFQALQRELQNSSETKVTNIFAGTKVNFPKGGELKVIYPFGDEIIEGSDDDVNLASIATTFQISGEIFYFGGDLASEKEDEFTALEEVTILKASHHGSKNSSSNFFLNELSPTDVIFSTGKENRYGHPSEETLERVENISARIFRTDEDGTISYECREKCVVVLEK
ncbi:MAG: MBL fold metallo-hydrolase [Candidatus Moranbacteria bacterium]|nr:MBL fold metallo-hydrolase [Candidatus Moranbacteria bacterium]